jgi:N-acetylmuramoyl-L-alanine amidase
MKKIYLSPSEQPDNRYAFGNTNEKAVCCEISAYAEAALKRNGFEVITGTSTSLGTRCSEADKWGADIYIPIHTNAYDGKVSGTRMFCYRMSGEGYKACQAIYDVLAPITPGKSENIKARPELYEVKTPKAPTVYIEVDFHDVPDVAKWLIENTEEIGEAICKGICNHYGVAYKEKEAPKNETRKLYRVQVGAYSNKANAEAMLAKLKKAGFEGYIKEN